MEKRLTFGIDSTGTVNALTDEAVHCSDMVGWLKEGVDVSLSDRHPNRGGCKTNPPRHAIPCSGVVGLNLGQSMQFEQNLCSSGSPNLSVN